MAAEKNNHKKIFFGGGGGGCTRVRVAVARAFTPPPCGVIYIYISFLLCTFLMRKRGFPRHETRFSDELTIVNKHFLVMKLGFLMRKRGFPRDFLLLNVF